MPTYDEIFELLDNTTSQWTTLNGVYGRTFTSKVNGNSIFLPAAGFRSGSTLYYRSEGGIYWSSTVNPTYYSNASYLDFRSGGIRTGNDDRCDGQCIRAVIRK